MGETIDHDKTVQDEPMHHRQIILEDGRYVIFYTFDRPGTPVSAGGGGERESVENDNDV